MTPSRFSLVFCVFFSLCALITRRCEAQAIPRRAPNLRFELFGDVKAMAVQPDGRILVGGVFAAVNGVSRANLVRLNGDGSLDTTWTITANGPVLSIVIHGSYAYLGGQFTKLGDFTCRKLGRIRLSDSRVDSTWSTTQGLATSDQVLSLMVDGTELYVGGRFDMIGGLRRNGLARLNLAANASLDRDWAPLPSNSATISAVALDAQNTYFCGSFNQVGSPPILRHYLARASREGSGAVDPVWNPNGSETTAQSLRCLAVDADALYIGGRFSSFNAKAATNLVRVGITASGAVDDKWHPAPDGAVNAMALKEGNLLAVGEFLTMANEPSRAFASITTSLGVQIVGNDLGLFGKIFCMGHLGGTTYCAGTVAASSSSSKGGIIRMNGLLNSIDGSFSPKVTSEGSAGAIAAGPEGKTIIGGNFDLVSNQPRHGLVLLQSNQDIDPLWNPSVDGEVSLVAADGNDVVAVGTFKSVNGVKKTSIAKMSADGSGQVDPDWEPIRAAYTGSIEAIAFDPDHIYLAGDFEHFGESARDTIVRVDRHGDGSVDDLWLLTFDFSVNGITSMVAAGRYLYIAGDFWGPDGTDLNYLARLPLDGWGNVDGNWNPNPDASVSALSVNEDHLYVLGDFDYLDQSARGGIARFNLNEEGSLDDSWHPKIRAFLANKLAIHDGWVWVTDGFKILRFQVDGTGVPDDALEAAQNGNRPVYFEYWIDSLTTSGGSLFGLGEASLETSDGSSTILARKIVRFAPLSPPIFSVQDNRLILQPDPEDESDVTHFQITSFSADTLLSNDGINSVKEGDFISSDEGAKGLVLIPGGTVTAAASMYNSSFGTSSAQSTGAFESGLRPVSFSIALRTTQFREDVSGFYVEVRKKGLGSADVTLAMRGLTATPQEDFISTNIVVHFRRDQALEYVAVQILEDSDVEGPERFEVLLEHPSNGATVIDAAPLEVTILDNEISGSVDSMLDISAPAPLNRESGALQITITPDNAGQWRLLGGADWQNSGAVLSGITPGNHTLEFRANPGFLVPEDLSEGYSFPILAERINELTTTFVKLPSALGRGSLLVQLEPRTALTNLAPRWRIRGEDQWRSGGSAASLNANTYTIEFDAIPGWLPPFPREILVSSNQITEVTAVYLLGPETVGTAPKPLEFPSPATNQPYSSLGRIVSDFGSGSGTVVKEGVVLTAAHVIFDDRTLTFVDSLRWFFRPYAGSHQPVAATPRGAFVLQGYASKRQQENTPGVSSTDVKSLDAAALFFSESAGAGGASGYLVSTHGSNWLLNKRDKILAGYPMREIPNEVRGVPHATLPQNLQFEITGEGVYRTRSCYSFPGNSGGPIFVLHNNGSYYPAAIYLGGSQESYARIIDARVVDIMNRAEDSSLSSTNLVDGEYFLPCTTCASESQIEVRLGASGALEAGADWSVLGDPKGFTGKPGAVLSRKPGKYTIRFKEIPGFVPPPSRDIFVGKSQKAIIDATYQLLPPMLTLARIQSGPNTELRMTGVYGTGYTIEFSHDLIHWSPLASFPRPLNGLATNSQILPQHGGGGFYRVSFP